MTLSQYHALKLWHTSHRHPLEKTVWESVLTLWMMAWAGLPAAWLLDLFWAQLACVALLFLPRAYVAWRNRLHHTGRLRCDWITALR